MGSKITLAEICTDISYGYTASATAKPVGPKFLRITDIQGGKVNWENVPYCEIDEKDSLKYLLQDGDIVIARTGNSTGENFIFSSNTKVVFASYLIRFRIDPKKANPKFIWLQMRTPQWWSFIDSVKTGSAQAGANAKVLGLYEVELPERKIQDHIADIGFNLLKKQDINSKINQTLEQMSQTLFKSWFVDFDPVVDNALDAGNPIPEALQSRAELRQKVRNSTDFKPLPTEIRSLFPSEFEETELGWVPKDWLPQSMHELVESVSITYPLKKSDKVVFLNTGDIEKGVFLHNSYSCTKGLPGQAKKSIKKGDILFSEIRPENKRYAFVYFESEDYVVSTKLMVLRAKNGVNPLLPYFILTLENNIKKLQRIAELRSGTFPQITFRELEFITFTMPNNHLIMDLFIKNCLSPNYNKMVGIREMNKNLTALRDTLLPKLISGELSLEDLPDLNTDTEAA